LVTKAEQLIRDIHLAFEHTRDNNRDLLQDEIFSMHEVIEEVQLEFCWQFLVAYIARNENMVNTNMED
jgi:hypothetical protein